MTNLTLPQWRSHKIVGAIQIKSIASTPTGVQLGFEEPRYAVVEMRNEDIARYRPQVGDYLVQYDSEYLSISPRVPFERGYSPLE